MTGLQFGRSAFVRTNRARNFRLARSPGQVEELVDEAPAELGLLSHAAGGSRRVPNGKRELMIGCGVRGYGVPFQYLRRIDAVLMTTVCHQRESC